MDREAHWGISSVLASALAQLSRDAILLADRSYRIIVASPRSLRILRRDHRQSVGHLLTELIPNLAPTCAPSAAADCDVDACDDRVVALRAGELARISVTPVPDGGLIAFVVRIDPVHGSDAGSERNMERCDAFLRQIARYLARFKKASDALEGVLALTAAALEIPSAVAFLLDDDGSHQAFAHDAPPAIVEAALHYFKSRARELDDRPVPFEWQDDQTRMRLLRETRLRSAVVLRIAEGDRKIAVLAVFSRMEDRFGAIEKTFLTNIAYLFDGIDIR